MTHRLLSLAAGTVLDLSPGDTVRAAAAAGFDAAGIWFDAESWDARVERDVVAALQTAGIAALDIEPVMLTDSGDHGERIVDAAVAVGARRILVASRLDDLARVTDRVLALAERAAAASSTVSTTSTASTAPVLAVEFLPALGVRTLHDAVTVARTAAHPLVGVLIDALHLDRSGGRPSDVADYGDVGFPYLQLCDAVAERPVGVGPLIHEALHGRLLPGDGVLPLTDLLSAVPDVPISVELRSEALRTSAPDPFERALVVYRATRSVVG